MRDVTEQRLAEQRLDESQRNLEALVENTGDSIWSVDREHRLITLNSAFALAMEARTGREPRAGQTPDEIFTPKDAFLVDYEMILRGERWWAVDVVIEGISLTRNYHSQLRALLKSHDFDELLERMRRKTRGFEAHSSERGRGS